MTVQLCKATMMSATATMRQRLPEQQNEPSGLVPLSQHTTKCLLLKLPLECFGCNLALTWVKTQQLMVCARNGEVTTVAKAWPDATTYGSKKMQRMVFIVLVEFALFVVGCKGWSSLSWLNLHCLWLFGQLVGTQVIVSPNKQTNTRKKLNSAACVFQSFGVATCVCAFR